MKFRDAVFKLMAEYPKCKIELVAEPRTYYGNEKVETTYLLRLHKFNLNGAFVWRIEFKGKSEEEVFAKAYKFITGGSKNV